MRPGHTQITKIVSCVAGSSTLMVLRSHQTHILERVKEGGASSSSCPFAVGLARVLHLQLEDARCKMLKLHTIVTSKEYPGQAPNYVTSTQMYHNIRHTVRPAASAGPCSIKSLC